MTWLRCVGWFVFLLLLLCPIIVAEGDEKIIVEDFDDIYYMNGKDNVSISTKITIIGDDLKGSDFPIEIRFYEENGKDRIIVYELEKELIDYQIDSVAGKPVYKYKNYTGEFGFVENEPGERTFKIIVAFYQSRYYNQLHSVNIDSGMDPDLEDRTWVISSIGIIIGIIIILIFLSAGVAIKYSRKDLVSETHVGLDIEAGDTEIGAYLERDDFKRVPMNKRGPVILKSEISQSEIEDGEANI